MNDHICASLKVYPIDIKYLGFSCVGKGRDESEKDPSGYLALTVCTTNIHFSDKEEKELNLEIQKFVFGR